MTVPSKLNNPLHCPSFAAQSLPVTFLFSTAGDLAELVVHLGRLKLYMDPVAKALSPTLKRSMIMFVGTKLPVPNLGGSAHKIMIGLICKWRILMVMKHGVAAGSPEHSQY